MAFTVVPLHHLDVGAGATIPFGINFVLQDVPSWLTEDKDIMADLSRSDRTLVLQSKHALVSEYEASAYGDPLRNGKAKIIAAFKGRESSRQSSLTSAFGSSSHHRSDSQTGFTRSPNSTVGYLSSR